MPACEPVQIAAKSIKGCGRWALSARDRSRRVGCFCGAIALLRRRPELGCALSHDRVYRAGARSEAVSGPPPRRFATLRRGILRLQS
jgi:hypothetical protein